MEWRSVFDICIVVPAVCLISVFSPCATETCRADDPFADQIHVAWAQDPSTSLTIVWRTFDETVASQVEYRAVGDFVWRTATGAERPSGTTGKLHEVTIQSLQPDTLYEYRVNGEGSVWSNVYTVYTAPRPGPADFDVIYVADTGIIGRLDGLATGTEQVIEEIAAFRPRLLLTGGDYAYFKTDARFGSLNNTIDAWFNQMMPIMTRTPVMPTYGNHEDGLKENYGDWSARFPTPSGFDDRRFYSFDIGDVHFVSIYSVYDGEGLSDGAIAWIEQDIQDAWNRGVRWVVPYMHAPPVGDGGNHAANPTLRAQLAPLFEAQHVKVVLTSHDQAYERSYPLVGLPDGYITTSDSRSWYTESDGVTYVKISPGGKLSNRTDGFSWFLHDPAPEWTAYRNNTRHHFARLVVSASGRLRFEAYGVWGNGTRPVMDDRFEYRLASAGDDADDDGILDTQDVCPYTADPGQNDGDGDGVGDACDVCPATPGGLEVDLLGCTFPGIAADFDGDRDVDLADFGLLQRCYTDPGSPIDDPSCVRCDLDIDGDVDTEDFEVFNVCVAGPGIAVSDPGCFR